MAVNFRFNEKEILGEIQDYIESTYDQHYIGDLDDGHDFQVIDAWIIAGIAEEVCLGTSMKYPLRYKKKGGPEDARKDLLKAIHYLVLAYNFGFVAKRKKNDDSSAQQ